jgi:hypothetical protein
VSVVQEKSGLAFVRESRNIGWKIHVPPFGAVVCFPHVFEALVPAPAVVYVSPKVVGHVSWAHSV